MNEEGPMMFEDEFISARLNPSNQRIVYHQIKGRLQQ